MRLCGPAEVGAFGRVDAGEADVDLALSWESVRSCLVVPGRERRGGGREVQHTVLSFSAAFSLGTRRHSPQPKRRPPGV